MRPLLRKNFLHLVLHTLKNRRAAAFLLATLCSLFASDGLSQEYTKTKGENRWFIALPLRFTQLQNTNTMLSGIEVGKDITSRVSVSLSVYHSFYLKSFKAEADLPEFDEQPRLFINCVGVEFDYKMYERNRFSVWAQTLVGWGFMTYDLETDHFKSTHVNYIALEPSIVSYFKLNHSTEVGLGIGYRPILGDDYFLFSSDSWNGRFSVNRNIPNGLTFLLSLKGHF